MPLLDVRSGIQSFTATTSFAGPTPRALVKGIVVLIVENVGVTDVIPDGNVTYGGTSVPRVTTNGRAIDSVGEPGTVYAFFLGVVPANLQTASQTVAITVASGTTAKRALVLLLSASGDTTLAGSSKVEGDTANPSMALTGATGQLSFACGALFSGQNAPSSITPGVGFTDEAQVLTVDFGTQSADWIYSGNGAVSAEIVGNPTVAWTVASEDVAAIGLSIIDAATQPSAANKPRFDEYASDRPSGAVMGGLW